MKKALIIDDTKNIRIMLTKCLEISGYEAHAVQNGTEGLKCMENDIYDLIFLDIKLPELSGTEVLKRIRSKGINTPVIIITAYPTVKNAIECTKMGAVSYLQKPFTAERLKNTLESLNLNFKEDIQEQKYNIKNIISIFEKDPSNPEIYNMLSEFYKEKGDILKSEKFIKIRDILNI